MYGHKILSYVLHILSPITLFPRTNAIVHAHIGEAHDKCLTKSYCANEFAQGIYKDP